MEYPKVEKELFNVNNENLQKLASLFPSAVKDGQLDIEALKEELGQFEEVSQEKYELNWAGKQNAKKEARKNVLGKTLRYIQGDGEYEDTTENLYIEGDNLEVLKLLRKNYYGSIKMIYIDPPYNTGNDFVYNDNFSMSQEELEQMQGERDEYGERLQKNSKDSAKYHTNWLNMMYPRLQLAKDLLKNDGVIFISIDDNEQANLKKLCDCIYGEENNIGIIIQNKQNSKNDTVNIQKNHEYILAYRKSIILDENGTKVLPTIVSKNIQTRDVYEENGEYYYINDAITTRGEGGVLSARPNLGYTVYYNPETKDKIAVCDYDITKATVATDYDELYTDNNDLISKGYVAIRPPKVRGQLGVWTWSLDKFNNDKKDIIITGKNGSYAVKKRTFVDPSLVQKIDDKIQCSNYVESNVRSIWDFSTNEGTKTLNDLMEDMNTFNNAKNLDMMKFLINIVKDDNFVVLDFFSGSATTAHAVMQLNSEDNGNRKFILVQLPEATEEGSEAKKAGFDNICEIGKERIRRAGQKIKEEIEQNNVQLKLGEEQKQLPDIGFKVFRVGETTLNWEKLRLQGKDLAHDYMAGTTEKDRLDFTPDYKNDLNVVYEIMLRQEGLPLTSSIEKLTDIGTRTYLVANSYLISLEENVTPEMIEKLSTLNPLPIKFVFRDSAFDDDIVLKDETFRRLNALIDKNTSEEKKTYTVEFI